MRLVETKLAQRFRALLAEEVADLRHLEVPLRAQKDMDAVAKGRALPHEEAALPQQLFEVPGFGGRGVRLGDEVTAVQSGQPTGVDLVGLDLGFGDDARLVGIGKGHIGYRLDLMEKIVEVAPIHGGLEDGADAPGRESREEAGEAAQAVGFDAALLHGRAYGVQDVDDAIALVKIDAGE